MLDPDRRELRRAGALVAVEPQVFDLIDYLVRERERVVTKDDLLDAIWNGRVVSESTLTSRINAARRALDDSGEEQRLIRTVARKGFRFVGAVNERDAAANPRRCRGRHRPRHLDDGRTRPDLPLPDRPAIAVLPFTNMSGEPEQEYFSDGISEDIITALSKLRWFFVIARNSSFIYKGKSVHMKQVAEELGVRYVVEGSVRKSGDRVRITAQLNDVVTGSHIWAERYDRGLADVFAVQDEITESIVSSIQPQLYAAENFRAQRKPPDNLDAWDLVMRALSHYWRVTRAGQCGRAGAAGEGDRDRSRTTARRSACSPPATCSPPTWAGWTWQRRCRSPSAPRWRRSEPTARTPGRTTRSAHVYLFARRFDDSLAEFELALRLNPNFSLAQGYYGLSLSYCGRWQEADEAARRALRAEPARSVFGGLLRHRCLRPVSRTAITSEAMRLSREALRQRGDFVGAHRVLTAAAGMAGQAEVARAALQELRRAQPNISLAWIANHMPIKRDADREHYLEAFRRAGLD